MIRIGFFVVVALGIASRTFAAACCSGGASLPSVIVNDDRWNFKVAASNSFIVGDVNSAGESIWRESASDEQLQTFSLSGGLKLSERWQWGAKLPVKQRHLSDESEKGLGDASLTLAFEPFPPYVYSEWLPRFFVSSTLTIPTGTSTYETREPLLKSFGSGFWGQSLGLLASRTWTSWDVFSAFDSRYQFSRSFENESVDPGWIFSGIVGAGWSYKKWRIGSSLGVSYELEKELKRSASTGPAKRVWDTGFEISYAFNDHLRSTLNYIDQTLVGPSKNVALERSLGFGLSIHGI